MTYGIPYMGSKNQIAEKIIDFLASGKRFVDLFGGGFAMSHCALLTGKYDRVFYGDTNPLLPKLIRDAICGKYNLKTFKPPWVSREEFTAKKETDGYIKYVWSFGNNGEDYLFAKEIESNKRLGHDYCVDKTPIDGIPNCDADDIETRRKFLNQFCKKEIAARMAANPTLKDARLAQLAQLTRLAQLEQLTRLAQLERLEQLAGRVEIQCASYTDYAHRSGDVVYCDPPYESARGYNGAKFDHKGFYDWVFAQPYPVYFSSYEITDSRFTPLWRTKKRSLLNGARSYLQKTEYVYGNRAATAFERTRSLCLEVKND
nr:MAG TPA: DNA adenine methylase [Caudoviricetes sp.]